MLPCSQWQKKSFIRLPPHGIHRVELSPQGWSFPECTTAKKTFWNKKFSNLKPTWFSLHFKNYFAIMEAGEPTVGK
jgi:hypothetical protein